MIAAVGGGVLDAPQLAVSNIVRRAGCPQPAGAGSIDFVNSESYDSVCLTARIEISAAAETPSVSFADSSPKGEPRALRREERDIEDAVPYNTKLKPCTTVGGGVLAAPV